MATKSETTGAEAAQDASETLKSDDTAKKSKAAAGSALAQTNTPEKETSEDAATAASKTLQDGRTSEKSKAAAGSALAQKEAN